MERSKIMKKIIIQGAGFVGSAFAIACAGAKKNNNYIFEVSIIEQKDHENLLLHLFFLVYHIKFL